MRNGFTILRGCFAVVAVTALLARHAFDQPLLEASWCALLQLPLIVSACLTACGVMSANGDRRTSDCIFLALVLIAAAAIGWRHGYATAITVVALYATTEWLFPILAALFSAIDSSATSHRDCVRLTLIAWFAMTMVGAAMLALPAATHPAVPDYGHNLGRHLAASLLMSASAVSLCGASAYSAGEELRAFGQFVLIALMTGGMTLFSALALRSVRPWLTIRIKLSHVLVVTWTFQLLAALLLHAPRSFDALHDPAREFAMVAASCQSAFSMDPGLLQRELGVPNVFWIILAASFSGSVGIIVLIDRAACVVRRATATEALTAARRAVDLTSVEFHGGVLIISLAAILLWVVETGGLLPPSISATSADFVGSHATMSELSAGPRWRAALLTATNARSAGQFVVPTAAGALSLPGWSVLLLVMLVGGSVGSVAGGLRVGTVVLACRSSAGSDSAVANMVRAARRIIVVMIALILSAAVLLRLSYPSGSLFEVFFEAVSLSCSVGYSTGITTLLDGPGRLCATAIIAAGKLLPPLLWCGMVASLENQPKSTT